MGVFEHYQERFDAALEEELSLQEYLELCKSDPSVYATAAERLLLCGKLELDGLACGPAHHHPPRTFGGQHLSGAA